MPKVSYLERSSVHDCVDCSQPLKENVIKRKRKPVSRCYVCFQILNGVKEIRHFKTTSLGKMPTTVTNFRDRQKVLRVQYAHGELTRIKR